MTEKFHQRFNFEIRLEEAENRFVNRIHNDVFNWLLNNIAEVYSPERRHEVERFVCSKLGIIYQRSVPLTVTVGRDLYRNLQAIEALYKHESASEEVGMLVKRALNDSEIDLGIRWSQGEFTRSGAPLLDEKVINDVLGLLASKRYEGVLMPF